MYLENCDTPNPEQWQNKTCHPCMERSLLTTTIIIIIKKTGQDKLVHNWDLKISQHFCTCGSLASKSVFFFFLSGLKPEIRSVVHTKLAEVDILLCDEGVGAKWEYRGWTQTRLPSFCCTVMIWTVKAEVWVGECNQTYWWWVQFAAYRWETSASENKSPNRCWFGLCT